jgi:hypothetical protein
VRLRPIFPSPFLRGRVGEGEVSMADMAREPLPLASSIESAPSLALPLKKGEGI